MKLVIYEHDRACPCRHPLDEEGVPVGAVVGCHVNMYTGTLDTEETDKGALKRFLDGRLE